LPRSKNIDVATLDLLPVAVILFDDAKMVYANSKALSLFKIKSIKSNKSKLYSVLDFIDKKHHSIIIKRCNLVLKDHDLEPKEFPFYNLRKEIINVEVKSNSVYFNGKKVVQSTFLEINDRVEKNKILQQKWINYKNLLDSAPVGIFIHEGICIYSNKAAANILEEKNPDKLIGKNLINFIIPEQRKKAISRMTRAIKGEELSDLVYKIKTVKGKIIEVELKTAPFIYNDKPCVQTIINSISAEKQLSKEKLRAEIAEETNKQLFNEINYRKIIERELITQSKKYEAIFNSTSYFIWTVDRNLRITSFNRNYQDYIGNIYKHQLKVGEHISEVGLITKNKSRVKYWINLYTNFFRTKKDNSADFYELTHTSASGNTYYRELYFHPIRTSDGKIAEIAIIGQDITERRRNEQKIIEQANKLEAIYESGEQLNWTVNKEYHFTSFNKNFVKAMVDVYKVKPEINNKIYNPHKTVKGKEYHKWWLSKYDEVFAFGKSIEFTTEQYNTNGRKLFRQISLHPIFRDGKVQEISCISNDITELKHLQNDAINQAAKLNSIFESSSHLIWTVDKDFVVTSFNKNFSDVFKGNHGVTPKLKIKLDTIVPIENKASYQNYWYPIYKEVLKGKTLKIERQQGDVNGILNYKEIYLSPIKNQNNLITEIACLAHDVSEKKHFEQKIINQSAKLRTIFESGDHLIWTVNKDFELTSYNKNYINLINLPAVKKRLNSNEILSVFDTIQKEENKVFWKKKYSEVFSGKPVVFTHHTVVNKKDIYREIYLYPIFLNNEVQEVSVIAQNISERIENEHKISQSLKEKEVLLKEVHHRVKNNMQVISSILNLQSSYVKDKYALNLLQECQNRIKSMAYIHESLYQTKNFDAVNFSEYLSTLVKNLVHSYSVNSKKIKVILTLDKLFLNLDASIPCGLIINEIVSNSLKYAFPGNRDGIIFVTLKSKGGKVSIEVGDNGVGISSDIDIKNTKTLGLQLVDTLVEQINGTIKLSQTKGTVFNIEFKI
jgi:PAS domain S-box-containing protein